MFIILLLIYMKVARIIVKKPPFPFSSVYLNWEYKIKMWRIEEEII